jgi:eukaryotic-like serine/threonine-protein kinase
MSNAADPTAAFFANLRASGLLQTAQLQELWNWIAATRPDVQGLAKEISRRGWLTAFQIKEIFKGRGHDLRLDRFVLKDLLGEGGMGRVYKAVDTRMGRDCAVKIIRKDKLSHPAAASRFKQEIEALGKMPKHPNVVHVYDAELDSDTQYYSMELIDGTDLTKMVRSRGPLPIPEACEYIRQAALGLQHAFEAGLVHRDIKPSNIIVARDGRNVKLVDLGLARLMENEIESDAGRITQEGFVIGTPDFLSPEQARNPMGVDIRADIYALGGTLYYILTGKVPFDGANPTEKLLKHCTEPPPSLLAQRTDAPVQVEQIIHWCMAKPLEARPQTPLQLALALQPFCPVLPPTFAGPSSGRHAVVPKTGAPAPIPAESAPHPPLLPGTGQHPAAPPAPPPGYQYPPPGYPYPIPPQPGYPGAYPPGFPPVPEPDPNRSSQVFKLPPQTTEDDPIRRRSEGGFPWSIVLLSLGAVFVIALFGFAIWRGFLSSNTDDSPPDSFTNSRGIRMVRLEGGKFRMGSPLGEVGRRADEGPQHEVAIRGPLLISATEVSHTQYLQVMKVSPAKSGNMAHKAQNLPVESVTWDEANDFCQALTEQEKNQPWMRKGWAYRLPTEAEWEYAARAGTETPFAVGDGNQIIYGKQALFLPVEDDKVGVDGDPRKPPPLPHEVGKTEANRFGLYDVHGNVAEWCQDWYKPSYSGDGALVDPTGPTDGDRRVVRGGSFKNPATDIRSASRYGLRPNERRDDVGFRIVYAPVGK